MSGPQNVVIGDQDEPTRLPETEVPQEALAEEQKLARYSKTAEFKRLKEFMELRIKFYQMYLPDGSRVEGDPKDSGININLPREDITAYWMAACIVIKEFQNILNEYELAREAVENG